jgi:membrane protease YdiL (CAAX protease family)
MNSRVDTGNALKRVVVWFFVATFCFSWALWVPMALFSQGIISIQIPPILGIVVGGLSPSFTAVALTIVKEGKQGIRALFARLLRWRVAIQWYLFCLFAPAVIMLCAIALSALFENKPLELPKIGNWAAVAVLFLFTLILGGPLGEEIGWRGYALPRLLANHRALSASLIVGVLWGLWHLPLFWIRPSLQADIPIGWFMASILAESVLYTWVHMHTRGSLLLAILFHAAVNTWAKLILLGQLDSLDPLLLTFGLEIVLAVVVVVLARQKFLLKPVVHSAVGTTAVHLSSESKETTQ